MSNTPLVSVIVPVHNGEGFLERALRSIFAQTYRPLDVIVVDDGSTDQTEKVAKTFNEVNYIFQNNSGAAAARNTGVHMAKGDFVAFLDSDDEWLPQKTSIQVDYHLSHPEIGYSVTMQRVFLQPGVKQPKWLDNVLNEHVGYFPSTLMVIKSVFEKVGRFDPSFLYGENADWFLRAKEAGIKEAIIPQTLLHKYIHSANLSHDRKEARSNVLRAFKNSVERRRLKKGGQ